MIAWYIVASKERPQLLRQCLRLLRASHVPGGWVMQIVVCCPAGDPAEAVCMDFGAHCVHAEETNQGAQFTRALEFALERNADLILVSGDDDLQSPNRLEHAAKAYERGAIMSGLGTFLMLDRDYGRMARWDGPAHRAGGLRNYAAAVLESVGGWPSVRKNLDAALDERIKCAGIPPEVEPLDPDAVGLWTVGTHGHGNVSGARRYPQDGETFAVGPWQISHVGEDHFWRLPEEARDAVCEVVGWHTLRTIANRLGLECPRDDLLIKRVCPPRDCGPGDLGWVTESCDAVGFRGSVLIAPEHCKAQHEAALTAHVPNPRLTVARLLSSWKRPARIQSGERSHVGQGAVIGCGGFGYERDSDRWVRFPHVGGVVIGDDVDIGANACIDRGALDDTVIGDGTKIDNHVHIAHGVKIGANCLITAHSSIGGSAVLEDDVILWQRATVAHKARIGKGAVIGQCANVLHDVEPGAVMVGNPARRIR